MALTTKESEQVKSVPTMPIEITVQIEDGVCQDVYAVDADGHDVPFVLVIDDRDGPGRDNEDPYDVGSVVVPDWSDDDDDCEDDEDHLNHSPCDDDDLLTGPTGFVDADPTPVNLAAANDQLALGRELDDLTNGPTGFLPDNSPRIEAPGGVGVPVVHLPTDNWDDLTTGPTGFLEG